MCLKKLNHATEASHVFFFYKKTCFEYFNKLMELLLSFLLSVLPFNSLQQAKPSICFTGNSIIRKWCVHNNLVQSEHASGCQKGLTKTMLETLEKCCGIRKNDRKFVLRWSVRQLWWEELGFWWMILQISR